MLMLARFPGEEIVIGGGITIKVATVRKDGSVLLGITAPREVPVHRREVDDRIRRDGGDRPATE